MSELKPCPFCGKPVTMIYNSQDDAFKFYHKSWDITECPVIEPIMLEGVSLADAAEAWNRRVEDGK